MADLPQLVWNQPNLKEKFKFFKQRLELFFKLKQISQKDKKCYFLLRAVDDDALEVYNSWGIEEDAEADYEDIIKRFEATLGQATVNFRVARLQLHYLYQDKTESLDTFVTRCRTLALKCDFEKKELEDRIIEQIIASTPIQSYQSELLEKSKALKLEDAIEIGHRHEAAVLSTEKLKDLAPQGSSTAEPTPAAVDSVTHVVRCENCNRVHEQKKDACPAKDERCHGCGRVGHYKRCCRKIKSRGRRRSRSASRSYRHRHVSSRRDDDYYYPRKENKHQQGHRRRTKRSNKGVHSLEHPQSRRSSSSSDDSEWLYDSIEISYFDSVTAGTGSRPTSKPKPERTKAYVTIKVYPQNGRQGKQYLKAKVDSGAEGNTLPLRTFRDMYPGQMRESGLPNLAVPDGVRLTAYNGTEIRCFGEIKIPCCFEETSYLAHFYVVDTPGPAILGLPACENMGIISINCCVDTTTPRKRSGQNEDLTCSCEKIESVNGIEDLQRLYPKQFDRLGDFGESFTAHLVLKPDARPYIDPPRKFPIHKTEQIKAELKKMETTGVIRRVTEHTEWCSSLAFTTKTDGSLRVCLDPAKLNKALSRCPHKVPDLEELTHKLAGATLFSKLDAKSGYWAIRLDKASQLLTTFRTPFGRYCFRRLPFGLSVSQDLFQQAMDSILEHCEGVIGKADDLTVFGKTKAEHDKNLHNLLKTAERYGLVFNSKKCQIALEKVSFFGHEYGIDGIHPSPEKVRDLKASPTPTSKDDLQRFLGFIQFLSPFIPNLSDKAAPLRDLLKHDTPWCWQEDHQEIFDGLKNIVSDDCLLQYYDVSKNVQLHCDASSRGAGACLMQPRNGATAAYAPVAYASKALTETEQRYSNLERELLAVVYGVERFSMYLLGRPFKVITDHRPLEAICTKNLTLAPPRVQRLLLRLQGYDMQVEYIPGKNNTVPDWLSRAPNQDNCNLVQLDLRVDFISFTHERMTQLQEETLRDSTLMELKEQIMAGWPRSIKELPNSLRPFWDYRDELAVENGVVLKGSRIIIPATMQSYVLEKLHAGHMGITKCQLRARDTVFWPRINQQIKDLVGKCTICQKYQESQMKEPMIPHEVPSVPWTKLGSDLFHFNNRDYVLVTDYTTKYAVVRQLPQTAPATAIVKVHKRIFSELGTPLELVTDRGPHYKAQAFEDFCEEWGIRHTSSSSTYAQSNGAAERTIKTVKNILRKSVETGEDPDFALLAWRCTPVDSHTESPAELMFKRKLHVNLPVKTNPIRQELLDRRQDEQEKAVSRYNLRARPLPALTAGSQVTFQDGSQWRQGRITEVCDQPRSYELRSRENTTVVRNRRHIRPT